MNIIYWERQKKYVDYSYFQIMHVCTAYSILSNMIIQYIQLQKNYSLHTCIKKLV